MRIQVIDGAFSVCQIPDGVAVDTGRPFTFLERTDQELSLVCPTDCVPATALKREDGWAMLRIVGPLEFSLIGILAKVAAILAEAEVSIFALSTFDTDYVLVRTVMLPASVAALRANGYEVD